jgi:4-carboxymuconolactone decarboxylase
MKTSDAIDTREPSEQVRFQRGLEVLSAVDGELGSKVVDSLADINPDMAHHIVAWVLSDIYARAALAPRDRQLVTLGIVVAHSVVQSVTYLPHLTVSHVSKPYQPV